MLTDRYFNMLSYDLYGKSLVSVWLFKVYFNFICMSILTASLSVHYMCPVPREERKDSSGVSEVVNHYMDAGNSSQVICQDRSAPTC